MNIQELVKKYWRMAALALAVILLIVLVIPKGNTYKTPIKQMAKISNAKTPEKMLDQTVAQLNGLGEEEMEAILKIMEKTEAFEMAEDAMQMAHDSMKENAGEKYKVKMSAKGKEKVDKDELEYMQEQVDDLAERFADRAEALKEDSTMLEDEGLSSKDIKKLIKNYEKLAKLLGKAKVTKAFDVEVKTKVTGSALDEPLNTERTVRVYKIGGRWVTEDALEMLYMLG